MEESEVGRKEQSDRSDNQKKTPVVHWKVEFRTGKTETKVSQNIPGAGRLKSPKCSMQQKDRSQVKNQVVFSLTLRPGRPTERKTEGTAGG